MKNQKGKWKQPKTYNMKLKNNNKLHTHNILKYGDVPNERPKNILEIHQVL